MSDWLEKVHAHADGELGEAEAREVGEILSRDPRAAAEHQWAVYLRGALRDRHVKPDHEAAWTAAKVRLDAIDALSSDSRAERFVTKYAWGFVGALAAVVLFAGLWSKGGANVSSQEVASAFSGGPITQERDVAGTAEADRALREQIGASLPQIEPLVTVTHVSFGERAGHRFARLFLVDNSGPLDLLVFDGANGFESFQRVRGRSEYFVGNVNGQPCVGWIQNQDAYMVSAPRSVEELVSIADAMRR